MRSPVSGEKSSSSVSIATSCAKSWKTSGRERSPSSRDDPEGDRPQAHAVPPQGERVRRARRASSTVPLRPQVREALEERRLRLEDGVAAAHEVRRLVAADEAVDLVSVAVQEEDRRERERLVAGGDLPALALLGVDARGHDGLLRPGDDARVRERRPVHDLAGAAPRRDDVEHDGLVLGLRAPQDLGERPPLAEGHVDGGLRRFGGEEGSGSGKGRDEEEPGESHPRMMPQKPGRKGSIGGGGGSPGYVTDSRKRPEGGAVQAALFDIRVASIASTSATREPARADLDERPRQPADHLPEEVRPADAEEEEVGRLGRRLEARERDLDERRVVALGVLAEAPEVVAAREKVGRGLHRARVEPVLDPPDVALAERGAPPRDPVAVDARRSRRGGRGTCAARARGSARGCPAGGGR